MHSSIHRGAPFKYMRNARVANIAAIHKILTRDLTFSLAFEDIVIGGWVRSWSRIFVPYSLIGLKLSSSIRFFSLIRAEISE